MSDVAKGAALMTGTSMNYDLSMAFAGIPPNKALAQITADACMQEIGAPNGPEDYRLASFDSYDDTARKMIRRRNHSDLWRRPA